MIKSMVTLSILVVSVAQAAAPPTTQSFHDWAPTPPMGWNSWDCFGGAVTEEQVLANADYVAKHLKSHGWNTMVIDGRWCRPDPIQSNKMEGADLVMDENGRLRPAPNRFPSTADSHTFKPIADAVHAKGLKFGFHILSGIPRQAVKKNVAILGTDVHAADIADTNRRCSWSDDTWALDMSKPGAQAYYDSVFALYASWEIDFIKVDDLAKPYHKLDVEAIRRAIDKTGRKIVFSTSAGPLPPDGVEHVPGYANMWRMSGDFWDVWRQLEGHFDALAAWSDRHIEHGFADGDMLPIGSLRLERPKPPGGHWTRFTHDEQITLMTLWSIARSPLFAGGNLPDNDAWTLSLLTNDEVIAVDQHSSDNHCLFRHGDQVVWTAKAPEGDDIYVAIFNAAKPGQAPQSTQPAVIEVTLDDLKIKGPCRVRDLWTRQDLGVVKDRISASINSHGAVLYRVHAER